MRKLERELGAISFVPHATDASVFDRLIEWKRAQYARTASHGSLEHQWALEVLQRVMARQSTEFAGMLSAWYAGDRMIAVHAGMRSATTWHYWYPAYDPEIGSHEQVDHARRLRDGLLGGSPFLPQQALDQVPHTDQRSRSPMTLNANVTAPKPTRLDLRPARPNRPDPTRPTPPT